MKYILLTGSILTLSLFPSIAYSETIKGKAFIIDGDTLTINNERIRILGIDAVEKKQFCENGYNGTAARNFLINITKNNIVSCETQYKDRYGRSVAYCATNGRDIGKSMVQSGHAFAYLKYSKRYLIDQIAAKFKNKPIWANKCKTPEEYRRG